ncbi:MAG: glycosyltransferase [Bacteroidota bacterium]|nr:glycosyltransferase [Bacteroidota bacterium]
MKNNGKKNIFICPLAWGTGHATRIQLIAAQLKKRGHKIYIAAPRGLYKTFDKNTYDEFFALWSPPVYYPGYLPLYIAVLLQLPVLLCGFLSDRLRLPGMIRKYNVDIVISDNRFGMWSSKVYSIYVTHQLRVALPRGLGFFEPLVSTIHRSVARRYDECWVPDLPGDNNLSGRLSHDCRMPANTRYIGPLSRFALLSEAPVILSKAKDLIEGLSVNRSFALLRMTRFTLALLSGPEPQRTRLENIITSQKNKLPGKLVILAGTPGEDKQTNDDIIRYPWLDGTALGKLMLEADLIVCRSGYSTIMDLFHLGKTAILIPTPGQPEQEYLALYMAGKYGISTIKQKELAKIRTLPDVKKDILWLGKDAGLLDKALDQLFKRLP